ncbi:uncharacterized protein LOC132301675 [Cornus florida]|uniref:uncharacterized protein LOC132301675 n=1 Tax=Cornus florida TaxID=4283 RepID=UPI002896AC76|nr:uncharacterized protein LOC132301675 [Cornus florida]
MVKPNFRLDGQILVSQFLAACEGLPVTWFKEYWKRRSFLVTGGIWDFKWGGENGCLQLSPSHMKNKDEMASDQEINRKRKNNNNNNQDFHIPIKKLSAEPEEDDNDLQLTLSLSFRPSRPRRHSPAKPTPSPPPEPTPSLASLLSQSTTQTPLQLSQSHPIYMSPLPPPPPTTDPSPNTKPPATTTTQAGPSRVRRNPTQAPREGKSDTVPAPFPWATTHRATVHSVDYLVSKEIFSIAGEVQCKRCERNYEMEFNLRDRFYEVGTFIVKNKSTMHDRAPTVWMYPVLPTCKFCNQENSAKPVISNKKKTINWLFLLLGQMLGCCTLEQLKYFCKHTKNHRTGAKDRVLYLTYLSLCKQLDPNGPFDR